MVLPTILSRCQPLYFKPLARSWVENILHDQFEYDTTTARSASRIAGGNLEAALKVASENSAILRELAFEIVKMAYHKKELEFLGISANNRDLMNAETIATLINYVSHTVSDITILATNPDDITNVDKRSDLESMVIGNPYFSEDALEFLILGAKAVQIGTANFINPQATMDVLTGIEKFMQMSNIVNISKLTGTFKV